MYTFNFKYADGQNVLCEHITSAAYSAYSKTVEISGDEILTHHYSADESISLFGTNRNYTVLLNDIRCIGITAE